MFEIKRSTAVRVPLRLLDASDNPVAGVPHTDVTVTVEKSDGTTANVVLTGADWAEITTGAFSGSGKYSVVIPASVLDVDGPVTYAVKHTPGTAKTYLGTLKVIPYDESDTIDRLTRVLGLLHENSLLDQTVFDSSKNLTSGRLRIYDSKANADAASASSPAGGATGLLATYTITAVYGSGTMTKYLVTKA